jgi:UDP-N-acetylglucosamine 2-epimerase (non-hydrolysing)
MKNKIKIAVIVGTRPEIIKMSPIIRECEKRKKNTSNNFDYFILHTGQHYSYSMDKVFFEQLNLPKARYNLDVGSGSHGVQTAKILAGVEEILIKEQADVVLVQGDTNTVLAGALAASKLHIKVGHVEAGLRSYDRRMPEEINRVVADHIADFCFAPTQKAQDILIKEGIDKEKIFVTGNTIVDAVFNHVKLSEEKSNILSTLGLQDDKFFLVTSHRQENVDDKQRFTNILMSLSQISQEYDIPVVYPMHPRAKKMMQEYSIPFDGITLIDPVNFFDFLQLQQHAQLVLTDSGGVQEETCILGRPCVTLRDNTERPETVEVGGNILAGTDVEKIKECVSVMLKNNKKWVNPFGDGKSGEKIIDILEEKII